MDDSRCVASAARSTSTRCAGATRARRHARSEMPEAAAALRSAAAVNAVSTMVGGFSRGQPCADDHHAPQVARVEARCSRPNWLPGSGLCCSSPPHPGDRHGRGRRARTGRCGPTPGSERLCPSRRCRSEIRRCYCAVATARAVSPRASSGIPRAGGARRQPPSTIRVTRRQMPPGAARRRASPPGSP